MDHSKATYFMQKNRDILFPNKNYSEDDMVRALDTAPNSFETVMDSIPFQKPSTVCILAVLLGIIGADRFYLGDMAMGVLKLVTWGGLGIWWIADIISAAKRCRLSNCKKLMQALNNPSSVSQMSSFKDTAQKVADTAQKVAPLAKQVGKSFKELQDSFDVNKY